MTADGGNRLGGSVPVAAAVLWGTVGPAQLLADTGVSPVSLGACRMLLGGLVLGLCTARAPGLRTLRRPAPRGWTAVAILVTAAFQICFLEAVERMGAALATAVALGTTALGYLLFTRGVTRISAATTGTLSLGEPLVATVLGIALLGERPTVPAALGAALLLGGLVVVPLPARGSRYRRPVPPAGESGGIRSRSTASIASGSSGVRNGRT